MLFYLDDTDDLDSSSEEETLEVRNVLEIKIKTSMIYVFLPKHIYWAKIIC